MFVLYEDNGKLKAEAVLSEAEKTLQIESATGKRSKIRRTAVLLAFQTPKPEELLAAAQDLAATLDVDLLWECSPQETFEAAELAREYYGHEPNAIEQAAIIIALSNAPAYFHRRSRSSFRPAPPDILKAALAAIEKRKQQARQQQEWTDAMLDGQLPDAVGAVACRFLDQPDKNSLEWKAFDQAVRQLSTSPEKLLLRLGVWPNPLVMMRERFFATHFPRGRQCPDIAVQPWGNDLPQADALAYSLDDANTTEIDDALSVEIIDTDTLRVGIHIAVPALAAERGSALAELAHERMSTVYMPGDKIPMLPEKIIEHFSLLAGAWRPALSLYITGHLPTGEILQQETRLERICVKENLRSDHLGDQIDEAALNDAQSVIPLAGWLRPLWQFATALSAQRDRVRGKPEINGRIEFSFELDGPPDDPDSRIRLIPRQRNAPLERMIAEYMILANSQWGALLARHGVPGIYRSQQMGRTRMSTQVLPHESIAVAQYIWSTSPLRRYVDLVNQGQILAAVRHGVSARLAAPYKPKDADLYALISAFESQYANWSDFQSDIERYWCLRWLQQQGKTRVSAHVLRDSLVRLVCAPLVTRVPGLPELERGHLLTLDILGYDEISLDLECRLAEIAA